MQNSVELRQKGHERSQKTTCGNRGKILFSEGVENKYKFHELFANR
jgi:hypothetical protein